MNWHTVYSENLATCLVSLLIVAVSFNRLLRLIWPLALLMPLVPLFSVAYSGYPDAVYLWSYLPIAAAVTFRLRLGAFPR